ncbi:MAG TPA: cysteine desulfurase NifS, partial [Phycisphaerales bacterium]|nr:cysteine desulfurase NifS [Phycisphaerales bacterium]
ALSKLVGCDESQVVFTSGGTEAANLALLGAFRRVRTREPERTIVACPGTEHPAVLDSIERCRESGAEVIRLAVDSRGVLELTTFERLLEARGHSMALCSVMWANNETGVIQPIERIGSLCREHGVLFHTDAVQWIGRERCDLSELPVDLLTCSAHKLHGPKGAGALVLRKGVTIEPRALGGPQERERRGGTENVAAIAGFGRACELASDWLDSGRRETAASLRDRFETSVLELHPGAVVNGGGAPRIWNTVNIGFPGLQAQLLVVVFSERGLAVSGGAACASGSLEVSGVLGAMEVDHETASGSLRFSLARDTTDADIDAALEIIADVLGSF